MFRFFGRPIFTAPQFCSIGFVFLFHGVVTLAMSPFDEEPAVMCARLGSAFLGLHVALMVFGAFMRAKAQDLHDGLMSICIMTSVITFFAVWGGGWLLFASIVTVKQGAEPYLQTLVALYLVVTLGLLMGEVDALIFKITHSLRMIRWRK